MNTIKVVCNNCETEFEKDKKEFDRIQKTGRTNFYCGLSCANSKSQKIRKEKSIQKYNIDPMLCKQCSSPLSYESSTYNKVQFCNHSCAAIYLNLERGFKSRDKSKKKCGCCDVYVFGKKSFCSKKCGGKFKKNESIRRFHLGELSKPVTIRRCLLETRGHQCEDCKNKEWKCQPINLTVHHIDGDATNNLPTNLQLLCWNCHSMTPNYGSKNKNSTRVDRYNKNSSLE
jgi:hypothetical protein